MKSEGEKRQERWAAKRSFAVMHSEAGASERDTLGGLLDLQIDYAFDAVDRVTSVTQSDGRVAVKVDHDSPSLFSLMKTSSLTGNVRHDRIMCALRIETR